MGPQSLCSTRQPWAQFAGEVTIKSADASIPQRSLLALTGVQNLTFDGVKFDYVAAAGAADWVKTVDIDGEAISLSKILVFDGDLAHGANATLNGYGTGFGLAFSIQIT